VYPNWKLDLRSHQKALERAGYKLFVYLIEPIPKDVKLKKRPGLWNWELELL
jgi:putative protease